MISFVRGRVASVGAGGVVIDVGGIGLHLACTPNTIAGLRPGQEATVPSALVVREDSLTLFGFADDDERSTFDVLQTVSGVGPRLAQAVLGVLSPEALRTAVARDDLVTLTKVPGIGRKGAQRIVLELKDRLAPPTPGRAPARTSVDLTEPAVTSWSEQVHAGLTALGWAPREADAAVAAVEPLARDEVAAGREPVVGLLLREALRSLDRA